MNRDELDRVRACTSPAVLEKIDRDIEDRVRYYAGQSRGAIGRRIDQLDLEWDLDQWLGANAAAVALGGIALGLLGRKRWLLFSGTAAGMLLQHAMRGWCLPVPLLRRLGIRTRSEIEREKFALKALRGDFETLLPRTEMSDLARSKEILRAIGL
jgi:hypothetical protein